MSDKSVMIEIRGDIADINAKLSGLNRQFKKNREAGERAYEGVGKKLSAMKNQIMKVVGVIYTLDKVWDAMNLAAKAQQEKVAFENLAASYGKNADAMIDQLKRVSGETISTVNLIEKAGSAMMMGLKPNEVIKLMEIARATSRQTGQSISKAFEDIALGVARQSRKILDNLGIIVKQEQANEAYAKSLNKTASELTDAERRQAFMNATMKAGADLMKRLGEQTDTYADKLQRMQASFENFKVLAGEFGLRFMSLFGGIWKGVTAIILDLSSLIYSLIKDFAELVNKIPGVNVDLFVEKYKKETAIARMHAERLAQEAGQAISDAFDFSEDKKAPINKLFLGGKTPEEAGEELAKDLATALKKAQEGFQTGLATPSPLDLALRRGPQPIVTEAAKLAEQFTKEFEEAKQSVSRLDEALMVSGATLSRLKAPVDSFAEHFKDKWHLMTDTARTDIEILADAAARAMSSMASGIGDAIARAVVYGEDLGESMKALLARVSADIISMLIEIQIQKWISHLIGKATMLSATTAEALAGVSLAAINAFKSTAAIPIIGPALAPAAAAAAVAQTTPFATTAIGAAAAYGEGGISWKRELAWVGEKGPEAHIPLKSGAVPVKIEGGGGSGVTEIHIHAVDAASFTRLVENNPGAIVATVDKAIKRNARLRHTIRGFA